MLSLHSEKSIKISIWLVVFTFPLFMTNKLGMFINTGALSIYWLLLPVLISVGVLFKFKIARWLMLLGFWLLLFYEFIGTNTGMTVCFSSSLDVVVLYSFFYATLILVLSTNLSYKLFGLDKNIRIHELLTLGIMAFSIIYFDMIYYWFLR